jgi:predicted AlkP superfamily phosphohydrolase/phosphomutase
MKILVIGLAGATPELLLGDERLTNVRRLMEHGCYGRLESSIPPTAVPAWMCLATSQDAGSLGVYGRCDRMDFSYSNMSGVHSGSIEECTIWDQLAREGKRSVLIGVPPSYPPRKIHGLCVGCFLTPSTHQGIYTHPAELRDDIARLVGDYPVDVKGFRTHRKAWLLEEIYAMSRKQFAVVRHLMQHTTWDYLQFVEIGLDRLQRGFWQFHDPQHLHYVPGNPFENAIRTYYLHLDEELEKLLEVVDDDTALLVVSDRGAQRLDGGFCVNEWLVREGLLVLNEYPPEITPFSKLSVNWEKTTVWSEGGSYARVFFNVKGREPNGVIARQDYEQFRDEITARFEATVDHHGKLLGTLVFKPEEIYKTVRNVAPDLIVHFGALSWRSMGGVGYPSLYTQENGTGPDGCNPAQFGSFILAAPTNPLQGELQWAHLLDISPTLLELGGYDIPTSMQGQSLATGQLMREASARAILTDEETLMRDRLRGLGYIA